MQQQFGDYTLRLIKNEDLAGYYRLIENNRKRLEDFFAGTVAITQTLDDTRNHLEDVVTKNLKGNYYSFVVTPADSPQLIASIQVKNIDHNIPKAELGYYVDAAYEGKGVVTKAVGLIIDYCFNELQYNKLFIRTYEGNVGSRKVAEKNGFIFEGTLKCDYKTTSGKIIDTMHYALLRPGFEY